LRGELGIEEAGARPTVALERELHVLRGDGIAVLEPHTLPQREVIGAPVAARLPGLRESGARTLARKWPHQGIVNRVVHHQGQRRPRGLRRIEEGRRKRHVHPPRHRPPPPPPPPPPSPPAGPQSLATNPPCPPPMTKPAQAPIPINPR